MTAYTYNITFDRGTSNATGEFSPAPHKNKDRSRFIFKQKDTITFAYGCTLAEEVIDSFMLVGSQAADNPAPSPFEVDKNMIDLTDTPTLTLTPEHGQWGFTVSVAVKGQHGITALYLVPDPELQVGSMPS